MEYHSTDAIDVHSDEEQKPSPSALDADEQASDVDEQASDADEQASRRTITVNPMPEFGPKQPMPDHLVDILDGWHKKKGNKPPPCHYSSKPSSQEWKVFDREGKELELSKFQILSPCKYWVLVLHSPDFQQKLVRSRFKNFTTPGVFLIAWQGITEKYEAKCCAFRFFASALEDIVYFPDVWKVAIPDLDPDGEGITKSSLSVSKVLRELRRGQERQRERELEKRTRPTRSRREIATSNPNSGDASESSGEPDSGAEESPGAPSPSEEEEYGNVAARTPKRRRLRRQTSSTRARTRNATNAARVTNAVEVIDAVEVTNAAKVIFKLVSYKSGTIRAFPLEKCKTGRDLFDKAQEFFRLYDEKVDVRVLSCQPPSEQPQVLFGSEDCEGEFEVLIRRAKESRSTKDGTVTIEVTHYDPLKRLELIC